MLRVLAALLFLASLAGGVLYYGSDVFRTKADATIDEWTKWTPQNIAKDPKNYLAFALAELDKIDGKLKAHRISLRTRLGETEGKLEVAGVTVKANEAVLKRYKDAYASASRTYPVSFGGESLSEVAFQERAVEADRSLDQARETVAIQERLRDHYKTELDRTEAEMKKLTAKRQEVRQIQDRLEVDLAVGRANDLTSKADEIAATARGLSSELNKAGQAVQVEVKHEEKKLQAQSVKERFEQIMGSK